MTLKGQLKCIVKSLKILLGNNATDKALAGERYNRNRLVGREWSQVGIETLNPCNWQSKFSTYNGHQFSRLERQSDTLEVPSSSLGCPTNDMESEPNTYRPIPQIKLFDEIVLPPGSLYRSILDTYSKLSNAFVKWLRRFPFKKITPVRIRQANNVSSILKRMIQ